MVKLKAAENFQFQSNSQKSGSRKPTKSQFLQNYLLINCITFVSYQTYWAYCLKLNAKNIREIRNPKIIGICIFEFHDWIFCLRIFMEEVKLIRMIPVRYDLFGVCREYTACVDFLRALSRDKGLDNRTHLSWRLVPLGFLKFNPSKVRFHKLSSRFLRNCSFRKMSSWEKFWRWGRVWQTNKQDKERSTKSSTARSWSRVRNLIDSNSNSTLGLFWNATMTKMVRSDNVHTDISFELQSKTSRPQSTFDRALLRH